MKYRFIDSQRTQKSVSSLCRVLEVSRSGYYEWKTRKPSESERRRRSLLKSISTIHQANKQVYGSPRIHKELRENGAKVGLNTVARVMRSNGIQSKVTRRFKVTTDSRHSQPVAENLLNREFRATAPNQRWVSDVTYIGTGEGPLYLATVLDLFSRMIVGWSMSKRNDTALAKVALRAALANRGNAQGAMIHSDRGAPYASAEYQKLINDNGMICSMSRKGNCWDNAVMESFFHSLKTEQLMFERPKTRAAARAAVFDYIELFYNGQRRHSANGYLSPRAYEKQYLLN